MRHRAYGLRQGGPISAWPLMATSALALLAAGALTLSTTDQADAFCSRNGTEVRCASIDLNGFRTSNAVTSVDVFPNAIVASSGTTLGFENTSTPISSFTIGTNASIGSTGITGILIGTHVRNFVNDGHIQAPSFGVFFQARGDGTTEFTNNGTIVTTGPVGSAVNIRAGDAGDSFVFINTGTIETLSSLGTAFIGGDNADAIVNTGEIIGGENAIFTDGGDDQIINTGTIRINSGSANGAFNAAIDTWEGNDLVINDGIIRSRNAANGRMAVDLGPGNDIFEIRGNSQIFSDNGTTPGLVQAGSGTDTFRLGGFAGGTFNLDDLAANYRGFERFQVFRGDWETSGATTVTFSVESGGTLSGTGTFGGLTFNSGGTVAPGNSIGTLTINGDVLFGAGSVYQAEIDAASNSDLINATGTATINNGAALQVVAQSDAIPTTLPTYTILQAGGGVTGTFTTINDNLPDLDFAAIYNANTVQIVYTVAGAGGGVGGAGGGAGGGFGTNGGAGANGSGFSEKQVHPSALGGGLDGTATFTETMRRRGSLHALHGGGANNLTNQMLGFTERQPTADVPHYLLGADPAGLPEMSTSEGRDWAMWGAGLGSDVTVDDTATLGGWDSSTFGVAFGIERQLAEDPFGFGLPVLVGISAGYTSSTVTSGGSSADIDSFHVGTYATTQIGALSIASASAFGHQSYEMTRVIPIGAGAVTAEGETDGFSLASSIEAHYDLNQGLDLFAGDPDHALAALRFGPLAGVTTLYAEQDGFTETGAGILNLAVAGTDVSQTVTALGFAVGTTRAAGANLVSLDGRIAWEHVFGDLDVTTNSNLAVLPAATFATRSAPIDRNRLAIGVGTALELNDTVSAHARYDGRFSDGYTDHRGSAGITVRF